MKMRLIIKRTTQPPIDTPASIDFKTFDIDVLDNDVKDFITGQGNNMCTVTSIVIGSETLVNS